MMPVYLHLKPGEVLPAPCNSSPFKAILVIEVAASPEWRDAVADWLVQCGCRYLMAWGEDCGAWHDSVDLANLRAFDFAEIPENAFVMTTWHEQEPLQDVLWFLGQAASHPTVPLDETLIIHIALDERPSELLDAFKQAQMPKDD